jgi:signal transduction histidine kinase
VRDRGPGIDEPLRERIFDKYPGVRPPGYETAPGAGLGLFICRAHARRHGGDVVAVAAPGEGTMLRIILPIDEGPAE